MKKILSITILLALSAAWAFSQELPGKHEIKSIKLIEETKAGGLVLQAVTYTDDFGRITSRNHSVTVDGKVLLKQTCIQKDCKKFDIDWLKRTVAESDYDYINYLNLTDDIIDKYKIKEVGRNEYKGLECTIYTLEFKGEMQELWIWKGICVRSIISSNSQKVESELISLEENPEIPEGTFDVPSF